MVKRPKIAVSYTHLDPTTGQSLFWAKDDEGNAYTTADYAVASNCKEATGDLLPTVYGGSTRAISALTVVKST